MDAIQTIGHPLNVIAGLAVVAVCLGLLNWVRNPEHRHHGLWFVFFCLASMAMAMTLASASELIWPEIGLFVDTTFKLAGVMVVLLVASALIVRVLNHCTGYSFLLTHHLRRVLWP